MFSHQAPERFDLNKIVRRLESVKEDLAMRGKDEVSWREIGGLELKHLKKVDRVAYIRFVYSLRKVGSI